MSRQGFYDDDELDIRVRHGHGRISPIPVIYPEHRYRPAPRPYYDHGSTYLIPNAGAGLHRSRSTGYRTPHLTERVERIERISPPPPAPQPVIINNRIYNDYEDDDYLNLQPPHRHRSRSRSRSRASSFVSSREESREHYELEKTRKELEAYKLEEAREEEEKRIKKEMELVRLREEKRSEEEKKMKKKAEDEAIEKYKIKEAERLAKEKKEKDEREKEYQKRLAEDLRKSGMDERQIAVVTKKEKAIDPNRPTYTRMSRRHLSIETLNRYRIDYEFDQDQDYVLIKRWVPEYEQDFLWAHTRKIREDRQPVFVAIEGKKKKHEETEFEFVRKKKHERKPSPSPLLTFLAGGKR